MQCSAASAVQYSAVQLVQCSVVQCSAVQLVQLVQCSTSIIMMYNMHEITVDVIVDVVYIQ